MPPKNAARTGLSGVAAQPVEDARLTGCPAQPDSSRRLGYAAAEARARVLDEDGARVHALGGDAPPGGAQQAGLHRGKQRLVPQGVRIALAATGLAANVQQREELHARLTDAQP